MTKNKTFLIFFSLFSFLYAQNWNLPATTLSFENQDAFGAQVAINNNDQAIATWQRYDGSNYIIQTKYSSDGGTTWSSEAMDLSENTENAFFSQIAMNNSKAVVIWQRFNGAKYVIQTKYSSDNGVTWSASATDLSDVSQDSYNPQITMNSSSKAIAVWKKYDGSNYIVQSKYSTDGGVTWSSTATDLSDVGEDSYLPMVVINDSNNAIAIWARYDGSHFVIQTKYSTDGGATWNATAIDLSDSSQNAGTFQIALNNLDEAIAIWLRYDGSNYIVQSKYSTDAGATWSATADNLSDSGQKSRLPQIAINSLSKAIAIWERFDGSDYIVQIKTSSDSGATWSSVATDLSLSGQKSWNPSISLSDSNDAIAIWKRFSGYNWMIQTKDSSDAGSTWASTATNLCSSGEDSYKPEIFMNTAGQTIVIWARYDGSNWRIQAVNN